MTLISQVEKKLPDWTDFPVQEYFGFLIRLCTLTFAHLHAIMLSEYFRAVAVHERQRMRNTLYH